MCQDDSTPGEVYVYIGDKQGTGTAVERAGLTNGHLFGISASFGDDTGPGALSGTFQLVAQGNNGDVTHTAGPERTAHAIRSSRGRHLGSEPPQPLLFHHHRHAPQPTRLWAMDFTDLEHPELGGTIRVMVEGVFSNSDPNSALPLMMDNMTVTASGLVIMQEDPGNNPAPRQGVDVRPGGRQRCRPDERPHRDRAPRSGALKRQGSIRRRRAAPPTSRTRNPPAWSMSPA